MGLSHDAQRRKKDRRMRRELNLPVSGSATSTSLRTQKLTNGRRKDYPNPQGVVAGEERSKRVGSVHHAPIIPIEARAHLYLAVRLAHAFKICAKKFGGCQLPQDRGESHIGIKQCLGMPGHCSHLNKTSPARRHGFKNKIE